MGQLGFITFKILLIYGHRILDVEGYQIYLI